MKRSYLPFVQEYAHRKIILISGPRQCGKTTLAKMLKGRNDYLNYDSFEDRKILMQKAWDRKKHIIIFDELHKMRKWKQWLKGVYDTEGLPPQLVVTGSARLNTFKKVGDSLAGRYFSYRLHPFDVRELNDIKFKMDKDAVVERLLQVGGFPEPFLEGNQKFYNLWKKTHLDIILKQDLPDLEVIRDITSIELLIDLLRKRVGSPISYLSLAEDLQRSDKTIKKWLEILENMYVIFKILPYHKNIARSKLKQPKYYFYDVGQVQGDLGAKLENLVACSLLKEVQMRQDALGQNFDLNYLATKGGREIDFLISNDRAPNTMIEVKVADDEPSKNFSIFSNYLPTANKVQLVMNLKRERTFADGTEIRKLSQWLCQW